jgi:hypothetical protein
MDEIEQLVDQSRQDRIDTARRATEAREKLQAAERELTTLRRAYVDTWDKATAAGWTARELRALRLPSHHRSTAQSLVDAAAAPTTSTSDPQPPLHPVTAQMRSRPTRSRVAEGHHHE